jgi:Na+/H+-dicarboxylate symporter
MKLTKLNSQSPFVVFGAMLLGLASGISSINFFSDAAGIISEIFINLLKLISLPIIFLAITATITGMQDLKEMRFLGKKVFSYTIFTTLLAASVALILYIVIDPSKTSFSSDVTKAVQGQVSYLTFLVKAVPSNLVVAFTENNVVGIAIVALLFSFSVLFLPKNQKETVHNLFASLFAAVLKMTSFIIKLMPFGIWAFTTLLVKDLQSNFQEGQSLFWYLVSVTSANLIQGLIVLPLLLKFKGISPLKTAKAMAPALTLAFFSKSSNATLPLAIKCAEDNLKLSPKITNFSLPLCSVINMNACAGFILTTVLFVSMMNGITFSYIEMIGWIFLATLAAIGNAGVPMGCYFLASAFLISMNVPLHIMGIILPFYTLLDMVETAINVWSDSCVTTIVNKEVKIKDFETINQQDTNSEAIIS